MALIPISMFREDGYMDAWDILYQQRAPLLSFKVSDAPLNAVKVISSCPHLSQMLSLIHI